MTISVLTLIQYSIYVSEINMKSLFFYRTDQNLYEGLKKMWLTIKPRWLSHPNITEMQLLQSKTRKILYIQYITIVYWFSITIVYLSSKQSFIYPIVLFSREAHLTILYLLPNYHKNFSRLLKVCFDSLL